MSRDRRQLNALGDAFALFSPAFRREIVASVDPDTRVFLIRRLRRNAAGRGES